MIHHDIAHQDDECQCEPCMVTSALMDFVVREMNNGVSPEALMSALARVTSAVYEAGSGAEFMH